jgi:hypothetical protein
MDKLEQKALYRYKDADVHKIHVDKLGDLIEDGFGVVLRHRSKIFDRDALLSCAGNDLQRGIHCITQSGRLPQRGLLAFSVHVRW